MSDSVAVRLNQFEGHVIRLRLDWFASLLT